MSCDRVESLLTGAIEFALVLVEYTILATYVVDGLLTARFGTVEIVSAAYVAVLCIGVSAVLTDPVLVSV